MTAAEVLIKIRTLFERKGATEATDALKQTATTAKQTGQQVAQMGRSGSDSMNLMGAASALMRGNLQEAANASIPLLEKTKAMGLSMTQLSLAGALLSTVVAGLRAIGEWADAAAMRISGIQMGNLANRIKASAEAYDDLLVSMNKVTAEKDAALAYVNSMVDSYTRQALAMNEVNKQAELAVTTDETLRQKIEEKYAGKAASISGMSDTQKEANELKRSLEREEQIKVALAASKKREAELIQEAKEALNKGQNANMTASASNGFWGGVFAGKTGKVDGYQKMAADAGVLSGNAISGAKAEQKRQEQLEFDRVELLRNRNVAAENAITGTYTRAGANIAAGTAKADRERAEQKAIYPAASELDAEMADLHASDQQTIVSALKYLKEEGQLTVDAIKQWTEYLRQIKTTLRDQEARQRNIQ